MLPSVTKIVEVEDFWSGIHKEIFKAILSIDIENIDSLAVKDKLSESTQDYFDDLVGDSERILPGSSNALFYAETIRDKSKLRKGINVGQEIIGICYQENAEEAYQQLEDLFASFLQKRVLEDNSQTTAQSFKEFLDTLRTKKPDDPNVIRTGFEELDVMLQKLEGLVILAARTSVGKTSWAINTALNVAKRDHPVLMFSLEQPKAQIFERILSIETGIPLEEIRWGIKVPSQQSIKSLENLFESMFHIDDKAGIPTSYITSVARQKFFEWGKIGLIIVDYLHLLKLEDKTTVEALGSACKDLRALGKELGCPVLLLSQLRREDRDSKSSKRPQLADLRSSGEIEQVADQVIFLYRESYYDMPGLVPEEDIAEVIVAKSRNGRTGIVELKWIPALTKFEDIRR